MGLKVSWSVLVVDRGTGGEERPNNHSLLLMALAVLSLNGGGLPSINADTGQYLDGAYTEPS